VLARFVVPLVLGMGICGSAVAQSAEYMMKDCRNSSQIFLQDYAARLEVK
jgi:hypothetical protein